ncbi:MAG: hypothetical protein REJ23_11695, partial [Brevundimonas sp.]|nr:hypothetical protein [Brevundimonas sp.]
AAAPRPSNDNPPPEGAGARPDPGVAEPATAWPGGTPPASEAPSQATSQADEVRPGRPAAIIDQEAGDARRDFHRAAGGAAGGAANGTGDGGAAPPGASRSGGRSAALQAFFVANAGRGLMPSGESSGVLSPSLKTEET